MNILRIAQRNAPAACQIDVKTSGNHPAAQMRPESPVSPPLAKHPPDSLPFFNCSSTKQVNMPGTIFSPSVALLRSLKPSPSLQHCSRHGPFVTRRSLHRSPRLFEEEKKSFRGQLYESTARRIQRQREVEAAYAEAIPPSHFARQAAFTFCIKPSVQLKQLWLTLRSNRILNCAGLLVRINEACRCLPNVYSSSRLSRSERP